MILDAVCLLALALLIAHRMLQDGPRIPAAAACLLLAAALLLLGLYGPLPPGFGMMLLLGYALAATLSALARGQSGAPALLAGLAAGLMAMTGPAGVLAGSTAVACYGLIAARRSNGASLVIAAVLMFVPLAVLASYAAAALIETGLLHSIHAGADPFLRGRAPDLAALALGAPAALPLALAVLPHLRAGTTGALAIALGGLAAGLALGSASPLLPLSLAASLAAAGTRPPGLVAALGLGVFALLGPAAWRADDTPAIAPWRIEARAGDALPAWGAAQDFAAAHPGKLPQLQRRAGRYVLNLPETER
jgi:hypothetical protein